MSTVFYPCWPVKWNSFALCDRRVTAHFFNVNVSFWWRLRDQKTSGVEFNFSHVQ